MQIEQWSKQTWFPFSRSTFSQERWAVNHHSNCDTDNAELEVTLTAEEDYVIENTVVLMGDEDITDDVLVSNVITIPHVTSDVQIICTAVHGV